MVVTPSQINRLAYSQYRSQVSECLSRFSLSNRRNSEGIGMHNKRSTNRIPKGYTHFPGCPNLAYNTAVYKMVYPEVEKKSPNHIACS
jgi:hypothetical protein